MFHLYLTTRRHIRAIISLFLAILLATILFINNPLPLIAQENSNPITLFIETVTSAFKGRQERKIKDVKQVTGSQKGGARRGRCQDFLTLEKDEIPLTAFAFSETDKKLSPSKSDTLNVSRPSVWGQTIEQYPTFLFYIPYAFKKSEIENAKFVLLDKNKKMIAKPVLFKLPESTTNNRPILAKLTLPTTLGPLKDKEEYNWYFSIICNQQKPSRNPSVSGWIEKLESSVFPPTYQYYFDKGIWYDAISRLITSSDAQTLTQKVEWTIPSPK